MKGKVKQKTFIDREVFKTNATIQHLNVNEVEAVKEVSEQYLEGYCSECSVDFDEVEGNFLKTRTPRKNI